MWTDSFITDRYCPLPPTFCSLHHSCVSSICESRMARQGSPQTGDNAPWRLWFTDRRQVWVESSLSGYENLRKKSISLILGFPFSKMGINNTLSLGCILEGKMSWHYRKHLEDSRY